MHTTRSIDPEVLTGLRRGDERSLERVFREYFEPLTAEAKDELQGDAVAAPRVVERAFVRVWKERERFETPQGLDAFLHEAVHSTAIRERSRRAAVHRIEATEGVQAKPRTSGATVDEAWSHLDVAIHADHDAPHAVDPERDAKRRHEAAEHVASIGKEPSLVKPILGGLAVVAVLLGGMWFIERLGDEKAVTRALAAPDARTITSQDGQRAVVTLGDGSKATIGPNSTLQIPARFGEDVRALRLDGTAEFVVAPGLTRSFEVRSGQTAFTATGTAFVVRAYAAERWAMIRVKEGEVSVKTTADSRTVGANQAIVVSDSGAIADAEEGRVDEALGWIDGRFIVTDRPLGEALEAVRRWYGLKIGVHDSTLLQKRVTVSALLDSRKEAIAALEARTGLHAVYEGSDLYLVTTPPAAATKKKR